MNKIKLFFILVNCLIFGHLSAQKGRLSIGLTSGYITSNVVFSKGPGQSSTPINGITTGFVLQHMTSKHAGIQVGIQFAKKGIAINDSIYSYKREIDYVEIPILTHFEIGKKKLKIVINLGPQISFAYASKEQFNFQDTITRSTIVSLLKENNRTRNFQFGLAIGLALSYQISRFIIVQMEGRYYNSFTDVILPGAFTYFNNQVIGGYFSLLYNIPIKEKPVEIDLKP